MVRFAVVLLLLFALAACVVPPPPSPQPVADIVLPGNVIVSPATSRLTIPAYVALESGWLEVFASLAGVRDHETAVVLTATPSTIHAALLILGLTPGSPATYDAALRLETPPYGDQIAVSIEWTDAEGIFHAHSAAEILANDRSLPDPVFVFAGSIIAPNAPSMGPGEHYVADFTGAVVGLATFGHEVVASRAVHSHQLGIEDAAWQLNPGVLPEVGTEVTLVLTRVR